MSKSSLNQSFYIKVFLKAAGQLEKPNQESFSWWWNPNSISNLRLSKAGYIFVNKVAKITTYEIALKQPLLSHHLIKLARLNIGPYYIKNHNTIILLDDKVATLLTLHSGNLGQYLENLQL